MKGSSGSETLWTGAFRRFSSYLPVAFLGLVCLIPIWAAWNNPAFLSDDAYITLTFAKNLAAGQGFVFNYPPPVMGSTTPLLTLILAALNRLLPTIDLPHLSVFFTALCWLGSAWIPYLFRRDWKIDHWTATWLGVVIVITGWISVLGLETYLFAFLLLLSFSLYWSRRHIIAGFTTGLLFLTRGEGVLVLFLLGMVELVSLWKNRKFHEEWISILRLIVGFLLPVGAWAIYAFHTFGYLLPATMAAKQAQAQSGLWITFGEKLIRDWLSSWDRNVGFRGVPYLWWAAVACGLVAAGMRHRRWLMMLAWLLLYMVGYSILKVAQYWWYQIPILFGLQIMMGLGVAFLASELIRLPGRQRVIGRLIATGLVLFSLLNWGIPLFRSIPTYRGDERAPSYQVVCEWIRENTLPSDRIAFIEIGYLGYFTERRIVDLAGLLSPEVAVHIAQRDFAWGFWQELPEYYLYLPDFDWALAAIREAPEFDRFYEPVATLPGPRQTDFTVYKRRDIP